MAGRDLPPHLLGLELVRQEYIAVGIEYIEPPDHREQSSLMQTFAHTTQCQRSKGRVKIQGRDLRF